LNQKTEKIRNKLKTEFSYRYIILHLDLYQTQKLCCSHWSSSEICKHT